MTDPNRPIDPQERPEVVHHTTINAAPTPERRSGGGGALAFIVGGLVVAALIIGFIVFSNGGFRRRGQGHQCRRRCEPAGTAGGSGDAGVAEYRTAVGAPAEPGTVQLSDDGRSFCVSGTTGHRWPRRGPAGDRPRPRGFAPASHRSASSGRRATGSELRRPRPARSRRPAPERRRWRVRTATPTAWSIHSQSRPHRTPTRTMSARGAAPLVRTAWRVSVVNLRAPAGSRISARTA
jgi:hypothetical protein